MCFVHFQALSVGIFPYVLKLLQSSARELRPLLVFIWAKILAVDSVSVELLLKIWARWMWVIAEPSSSSQSCQADLVKDNGHKYFLSVLADSYMPVSSLRRRWDSRQLIPPCVRAERGFSVFQAEHRTMAVFILAVIVNSYNTGQVRDRGNAREGDVARSFPDRTQTHKLVSSRSAVAFCTLSDSSSLILQDRNVMWPWEVRAPVSPSA